MIRRLDTTGFSRVESQFSPGSYLIQSSASLRLNMFRELDLSSPQRRRVFRSLLGHDSISIATGSVFTLPFCFCSSSLKSSVSQLEPCTPQIPDLGCPTLRRQIHSQPGIH